MENNKTQVIVEKGIIQFLLDAFDYHTMLSDNAEYIFDFMFEDNELTEKGKAVATFLGQKINKIYSLEEINSLYDEMGKDQLDFTDNFYKVFPKIVAHLEIEPTIMNKKNIKLPEEQEIACEIVHQLGQEYFGGKSFRKQVREQKLAFKELQL